MGVGRLEAIADCADRGGQGSRARPPPIVASGTLAAQRTVAAPLSAHRRGGARGRRSRPPAVTVVGGVAGAARRIAWAERPPAARPHDRRHAGAGPGQRARRAAARARRPGGRVPDDPHRADRRRAASTAPPTTSSASPPRTRPRLLLERLGGDARSLAGLAVAAIGPGTAAALREVGLRADVVAERFVGRGALEALAADLAGTARARRPGARRRATRCPTACAPPARRSRGRRSTARVRGRAARHAERALAADAVAFSPSRPCATSSAALAGRDLVGRAGDLDRPGDLRGRRAAGIEVVAEAWKHDLDGLVDAIVSTLGNQERAEPVRGG